MGGGGGCVLVVVVLGVLGGWSLWGWGATQGDTETRRLQGMERAYEGAYTFGAYKRFGGQARSVKDPPTLWSGVLEHYEANGGGFLPLPPSALADLLGHPQYFSLFWPNGPSLEPFEENGS